MQLPQPERRVASRAPAYWRLRGALVCLVGLAVAGVVQFTVHPPTSVAVLMWLVVAGVAVAEVLVMPRWRYAVHRWDINDEAVSTQIGWWVSELRVAPISRVQTVDTERGPLMRLFGLSTVTVTTASAKGALHIPALEHAVATQLVSDLTAISAADHRDAT
ncbi:PH domain-containing protein [Branchiibius cervicis]|uniref:PH domain-containing protein n=1 Tax=Branchiibius cervicis TaxID=908252 RepID=A0ABW2AVN9_9MICO